MTMLNVAGTGLGDRYRIARVAAGLKQEELARYVGVSRQTLSGWEKGDTEPSASKLISLARATNQPLDWFAEGLDSSLSQHSVRPKGLEPLTFWSGASGRVGRSCYGLAA